MDLQGLSFSAFKHAYNRYTKYIFYLVFFFIYGLNSTNGQCTPDPRDIYTVAAKFNLSCTFNRVGYTANQVTRILLKDLVIGNTYRFSTVGETDEDTYLALYDSSGKAIIYNDDDTDAYPGCKQSTINFKPTIAYSGAYLILAGSGCKCHVSQRC